MLLELSIKDFALIDDLKLQFGKGLNIMTGETGAGKSIIIDSVNFVLGERSSKDVIRTGTDKTEVTAVFENVDTDDFKNARETYGLSTDDDVLILYRELNTSGRSICRINGNVVTTSVLKTIGNFLIDIHGQHQHQSLLNESYHIDLLDTFGGSFISGLKDEVKTIYAKVQLVKQNLKSITGDETERERKLSLLDYQVKEIDAAKLKVGEEEELIKEQNILNNSEKLYSVLSSCYSSMYENG
ncbi:MAG TPA: DNA repair protein RecN, partial [Clostridiaceae bacterium]|nr:DNA repair protein RecN [Clostridiaceae bacterium]